MTDSPNLDVSELSIEDAIEEVKEIISTFENGDVELSEAKGLYERAESLLNHVESELEVGDGTVTRVDET